MEDVSDKVSCSIRSVLEVFKERGLGHALGVNSHLQTVEPWQGLRHGRVHQVINV